MSAQRKPKLTPTKKQRAISAVVACIETGQFAGNELAALDRACELIRAKGAG